MDYAADISVGMSSTHQFEFKTTLVLDALGNRFPLVLYMEKPALQGQNANKLHLIACKTVPPQVRLALHPGAFRPRQASPGWAIGAMRHNRRWRP